MRILMINDYWDKGGAESVALGLKAWLESIGQDVTFVARDLGYTGSARGETLELPPHIPVRYLNRQVFSLLPNDPITIYTMKKIIQNVKPDIMHCHNIKSFGTAPMVAAAELGVPCVFTVHDYWLISSSATLLSREGGICTNPTSLRDTLETTNLFDPLGKCNAIFAPIVWKCIQRRIKDSSRCRIITVSNSTKEIFSHFIPTQNVETIPNGVALDELEANLGRESKEPLVLFMGGDTKHKGIKEFDSVAGMIRQKGYKARFVATGGSSSSQDYANLEFTGRMPRNALLRLIAQSWCLVFPSLWPEPCPISVIEAMALRKPVIGYRVGGVPEIVKDNTTGLLAPYGRTDMLAEFVITLLENRELRTRFGENGAKLVRKEFSLEHMGRAYLGVYKRLSQR